METSVFQRYINIEVLSSWNIYIISKRVPAGIDESGIDDGKILTQLNTQTSYKIIIVQKNDRKYFTNYTTYYLQNVWKK